MARNTRYVKKSATGGRWDVVKEGHRRATAHASTKKAAIDEARNIVRREGGGDVVIMNRAGKITDSTTIKPSRDRKVTKA